MALYPTRRESVDIITMSPTEASVHADVSWLRFADGFTIDVVVTAVGGTQVTGATLTLERSMAGLAAIPGSMVAWPCLVGGTAEVSSGMSTADDYGWFSANPTLLTTTAPALRFAQLTASFPDGTLPTATLLVTIYSWSKIIPANI